VISTRPRSSSSVPLFKSVICFEAMTGVDHSIRENTLNDARSLSHLMNSEDNGTDDQESHVFIDSPMHTPERQLVAQGAFSQTMHTPPLPSLSSPHAKSPAASATFLTSTRLTTSEDEADEVVAVLDEAAEDFSGGSVDKNDILQDGACLSVLFFPHGTMKECAFI
jgi:hypothetical protein